MYKFKEDIVLDINESLISAGSGMHPKDEITNVLNYIEEYLKNNKNVNETYCDILFSAETIKKDAKKNITNFYDHITHLMIHCFLHVNGYDHKKETDFIKMKKLEEKILMKFDLESPYLV